MLAINHPARDVPKVEYFDNRTQEFVTIEAKHYDAMNLILEHSLRSIAKWESRWNVPFVGRETLSGEELLDYIRCMTTNQQKNPNVYDGLTTEDLEIIVDYMRSPQSAWVIRKPRESKRRSKKSETAEMFYYAMIQYGIPMECENWHFNRLMALLDFCDSKGGSSSGAGGPVKRSQRELMEMYRAMNERNRKKYNSKG